jgi:hypothetical protein
MRNTSRNHNNIATRNSLFNTIRIVFVPETQPRFAICNAEDFM